MPELLLEIFGEEIPARFQKRAQEELQRHLQKALEAKSLFYKQVITFVTPRRLTAVVEDLAEATDAIQEERRGPRLEAPNTAVEGFLKAWGVSRSACKQANGYWYAEITTPPQQTTQLLPDIVRTVLHNFFWEKSMRWTESSLPWGRPIRNILCLFNEKAVVFSLPELTLFTNNQTFGHRFLAPGVITVKNFKEYRHKLAQAKVTLAAAERQALIQSKLERLATQHHLSLYVDQALLEEVTGLVEHPVAFLGKIDQCFMLLPAAVLSTSMRVHQKYFTLFDAQGKIAPYFGVVANTEPSDEGNKMLEGYERVLRARLSDATFFYDHDKKIPLGKLKPRLEHIVFHAKLGTVAQKVERLEKIMNSTNGKQAAALCKTDLLTEMVGEFPELQGIMGEIYALEQGEPPEVATAIREHYQPKGPQDTCPSALLSTELALADKMDTIVGFFLINEQPTGSKDPYALRRAALGIIRLIRENNWKNYNLMALISKAWKGYEEQEIVPESGKAPPEEETVTQAVFNFIIERLSMALRTEGVPHDCVAAILHARTSILPPLQKKSYIHDNIWSIAERAKALHAFLQKPEGTALMIAYRRAAGIVREAEATDHGCYHRLSWTPQGTLQRWTAQGAENLPADIFKEPQEIQLLEQLKSLSHSSGHYLETHNYSGLMSELAQLRTAVDDFFALTINAPDPLVRRHRLLLLATLLHEADTIADLSKIEG